MTEWPPKVWMGVVDPVTGDPIPNITVGDEYAGSSTVENARTAYSGTGNHKN